MNWDSAAYWAIKEREPGEGLWSTNYFIEMKIYRYRGYFRDQGFSKSFLIFLDKLAKELVNVY